MPKKVFIVLENGLVFEGRSFGAEGETVGEIVFATGMTGYLETLTDPSYYGQIVVQTFPLIGNYGMIPADFESPSIHLTAYVVREWCQYPSNFRSGGDLDAFLRERNIIGIAGIDTRELTRTIREAGVMNAKITSSLEGLDSILDEIKNYRIIDAVPSVGSKELSVLKGKPGGPKVALWDFGAKENIRRELLKRGCEVITFPPAAKADQILSFMPDGVVLSNGPGDPADNSQIIQEIAKLSEAKIPILGICLGHQLLALALGARTAKLKYGHRGANQPVRDLETGKVYITSQNHGYAVVGESLPARVKLRFQNVNDGTCEGLEYLEMPAFSVQFHPEAAAGPLDTGFLFEQFIERMEGGKRDAAEPGN